MSGPNWGKRTNNYKANTNKYSFDAVLVNVFRLRRLLLSAAEANMNSIRIWGGGVYESDDFYDITDELGILVWQDMMFACSMYPAESDFLQNVNDETVYQVSRLNIAFYK